MERWTHCPILQVSVTMGMLCNCEEENGGV